MLSLLSLCRNDTDLYTYSVLIYASFLLTGYCLNLVIVYRFWGYEFSILVFCFFYTFLLFF